MINLPVQTPSNPRIDKILQSKYCSPPVFLSMGRIGNIYGVGIWGMSRWNLGPDAYRRVHTSHTAPMQAPGPKDAGNPTSQRVCIQVLGISILASEPLRSHRPDPERDREMHDSVVWIWIAHEVYLSRKNRYLVLDNWGLGNASSICFWNKVAKVESTGVLNNIGNSS